VVRYFGAEDMAVAESALPGTPAPRRS